MLKSPQDFPLTTASHTPVLPEESLELLQVQPGGVYIDCTLGTGGHAEAILKRSSPGGLLLGIDADPEAIKVAVARLKPFGKAVVLVNDNFKNLEDICTRHGFRSVNAILFDLGLSSLQLADSTRGFSFKLDAPLDMRFNPNQELTAAQIVNTFSEREIALLLRKYGEERYSKKIARQIVESRPIRTSLQLAKVIEGTIGKTSERIHPATRTFQALRIAVNKELESLETALKQAKSLLCSGGRMVVISYHSLEDRIVKRFFYQESRGCLCPPGTPICICGHIPALKIVNKKIITPSPAEMKSNPRSRSARLRAAERTS